MRKSSSSCVPDLVQSPALERVGTPGGISGNCLHHTVQVGRVHGALPTTAPPLLNMQIGNVSFYSETFSCLEGREASPKSCGGSSGHPSPAQSTYDPQGSLSCSFFPSCIFDLQDPKAPHPTFLDLSKETCPTRFPVCTAVDLPSPRIPAPSVPCCVLELTRHRGPSEVRYGVEVRHARMCWVSFMFT